MDGCGTAIIKVNPTQVQDLLSPYSGSTYDLIETRLADLLPQQNEKIEFSQPERDTGVSVTGVFKMDNLQPAEPILF